MKTRQFAAGALGLFLLSAAALASTDFGVGTIVAVDEQARTFKVRYEFFNYRPAAIWYEAGQTFDFAGGWGQRAYFLDGKPVATPEEALGMGRAVAMVDDGMAVFVSSKPDFFFLDQHGTIEDGLCRVTLANAGSLRYATIDMMRNKVGVTRDYRHPIELLLEFSPEGMRGVLVVPPLQRGFTDYDLDCSKLKREGNAITGTVSFSTTPKAIKLDGDATKIEFAYEIRATLGEKGVVSGTWSGTFNGETRKGAIDGETLARRSLPEAPRVWLQFANLPDQKGGQGYIMVPFKAGKPDVEAAYLVMKKGAISGTVTGADLKLAGKTLSGWITAKSRAEYKVTIDATLLGGKWLHGTSTIEGGTTAQLRGGVCDDSTVQMRKCTKEQYAFLRAMQPEGSTGRILTYKPVLQYLEHLKAEGKSLPEVPKMKAIKKK